MKEAITLNEFEVLNTYGGTVDWNLVIIAIVVSLIGVCFIFLGSHEYKYSKSDKKYRLILSLGILLFTIPIIITIFFTPKTDIRYAILLKENQTIDALKWDVVKKSGDIIEIKEKNR